MSVLAGCRDIDEDVIARRQGSAEGHRRDKAPRRGRRADGNSDVRTFFFGSLVLIADRCPKRVPPGHHGQVGVNAKWLSICGWLFRLSFNPGHHAWQSALQRWADSRHSIWESSQLFLKAEPTKHLRAAHAAYPAELPRPEYPHSHDIPQVTTSSGPKPNCSAITD